MTESTSTDSKELEALLAALCGDCAGVSARIRTLTHSVTCSFNGVTLRLHFPAFRQGQATVPELIDVIVQYLPDFALPRSQIDAVKNLYGKIPFTELRIKIQQLFEEAKELFIRANKATNRNGEAGELMLYLLTQCTLSAPQLIAKMSLKTSREMPVHGADGIHVKYSPKKEALEFYWGEAKLYKDVGAAISAAVESIKNSLDSEKLSHEINIVKKYIDFSALPDKAKEKILNYLDPFDETANERHDIITCFIGFDFEAFKNVGPADGESCEEKFCELARKELPELAADLAKKIRLAKIQSLEAEIFFFPIPSVEDFRKLFQNKIGWR